MRRDYDGKRLRQGLHVWESPDILPRGAWLERLWQDCAYRDPFDTPVLLSAVQEEALWEQSIAASSATDVLLDLPATVSAALQAWSLLQAWDARCEAAEFRGLHDPEAFLGWMQAVALALGERPPAQAGAVGVGVGVGVGVPVTLSNSVHVWSPIFPSCSTGRVGKTCCWKENVAALALARAWSRPVISGGDRHGCQWTFSIRHYTAVWCSSLPFGSPHNW